MLPVLFLQLDQNSRVAAAEKARIQRRTEAWSGGGGAERCRAPRRMRACEGGGAELRGPAAACRGEGLRGGWRLEAGERD